jgi:hypothetical protein
MLLFCGAPLLLFMPLVAVIVIPIVIFIIIAQVIKYTGIFDFLFPKGRSNNVYVVSEPPSGHPTYTLLVGAHVDSSWHSNLFARFGPRSRPLVTYAVLSALALLPLSVVKVIVVPSLFAFPTTWVDILAIPFIPGAFIWWQFMTPNPKKASPGAMDNLSGISITAWLAGYFKEHPDKRPQGARILYAAFGAEEAGLKGSREFVQRHAGDLLASKETIWALIVDSVAEHGHYHVIDGDTWLGTQYDAGFTRIAELSMADAGLASTTLKNPIGGSDSASFCRAGIRTITLVAQDVSIADNYHTCKDTLERVDARAIIKMKGVILDLIGRVDVLASRSSISVGNELDK